MENVATTVIFIAQGLLLTPSLLKARPECRLLQQRRSYLRGIRFSCGDVGGSGWLQDSFVLTAAPAFVAGGPIVSMLGRHGTSQVFSFFALMPLLTVLWYYLLAWLLDRCRARRLRTAQRLKSA